MGCTYTRCTLTSSVLSPCARGLWLRAIAVPPMYVYTHTSKRFHFTTYNGVYMYKVYIYVRCRRFLSARLATVRHCRTTYIYIYIFEKVHNMGCIYKTHCNTLQHTATYNPRGLYVYTMTMIWPLFLECAACNSAPLPCHLYMNVCSYFHDMGCIYIRGLYVYTMSHDIHKRFVCVYDVSL